MGESVAGGEKSLPAAASLASENDGAHNQAEANGNERKRTEAKTSQSGIKVASGVGNQSPPVVGNQQAKNVGNQMRLRDWMRKAKRIPAHAKIGIYESRGIQYARYWWRDPGIRKLYASYIAPLKPVRSDARMNPDEQAKIQKLVSRRSRGKRHNRNVKPKAD
jgi:hypothetical protein